MIAATIARVPKNTAEHINERIRRQTDQNVAQNASSGPAAIGRRFEQLGDGWDVERYVETMAPAFTLVGMALGLTVNRKWFILPFVVQAFFLQHALHGWCPPVPLLRRLGVRTTSEIDE